MPVEQGTFRPGVPVPGLRVVTVDCESSSAAAAVIPPTRRTVRKLLSRRVSVFPDAFQ
jgi:hypothetical protein